LHKRNASSAQLPERAPSPAIASFAIPNGVVNLLTASDSIPHCSGNAAPGMEAIRTDG